VGTDFNLDEKIRKTPAYQEELKRQQMNGEADLPEISVTNRPLRDMTGAALTTLQEQNSLSPFLFVRSAVLVRVVYDERQRPVVETVSEAALRGYLTRSAEFIKVTAKKDKKTDEVKFFSTHVSPPKEVVQDILSLAVKPFSPLVGYCGMPDFAPRWHGVEPAGL
jgi:hypothetical protein